MSHLHPIAVALICLAACADGKDPSTDDTERVDTESSLGFTVSGQALDFTTQQPIGAGACVSLLDPTSMAMGGEAEPLGVGETDAAGVFEIAGVQERPALGILIRTEACDGGASLFPSISGIAPESYATLADGAVLAGQFAFVLSGETAAEIDTSATLAGYVGAPTSDGMIVGLLLDAGSLPVAGGSVSCGGCTAFYADDDPSDGWFTTGLAPNAATDPSGIFVLPGAGVGNYGADDGGAHTWTPFFAGSQPGEAVIIALKAD